MIKTCLKLIVWFLVHLAVSKYVLADEAAADTASAPKEVVDWAQVMQVHFENRVRAFQEQNQVYENVVLVGDSITEGFDVARYFPGRRVLNRGIGGDVIGNGLPDGDRRGLLRRLDESVFECAPSCVFLMIGINDLNSGHTPESMEAGYRELFGRIRKRLPELRLYVQTLLPTRGTRAVRNPAIQDVNARLEKLSEEFSFEFIDLHALMQDGNGELRAEFSEDGLHLTDPAYQVWRAEIERRMLWNLATEKDGP